MGLSDRDYWRDKIKEIEREAEAGSRRSTPVRGRRVDAGRASFAYFSGPGLLMFAAGFMTAVLLLKYLPKIALFFALF